MKKIVLLWVSFFVATVAVAQGFAKVTNTRIVQATKDTTVTYAGVKIFVPQGKTVILGQNENGSVVLRGQNVSGVKINNATVSFPGTAVLSINPQNNVVLVSRGEQVSITDGNGRTAVLSQGASVSTLDVRVAGLAAENPQVTGKTQKTTKAKGTKTSTQTKVAQPSQEGTDTVTELPAFVAQSVISSSASEQAAQDVKETEETLSNSSAR